MGVIWTIGRLIYDAAHLVAVLLTGFLMGPVLAVTSMGLWAWGLSALWLVLLLLDWTNRVNLHGSAGKLLAGLLLPAAMGSGEMLFQEEMFGQTFPPEVYPCFFLFLLLLGSILLRGSSRGEDPIRQAELLLKQGFELVIPEVIWLDLLGGAVFLMATFGFLLVVIIGELMAQNGSLFDYGGLAGMLAAFLVLHLAQSLMFWRGARLVKRVEPSLIGRYALWFVWLPVWNQIQARKLALRLQMWGVKDCY